ncbi:MAG: KOW domain-containing RNA-binding protein [Oscillospiraceae bacterium]|nr:KOW domain-containing RNA-binding protein [Oscillospiraceae bacterium]
MTVTAADIVRCTRGRDEGRLFLVLDAGDGYVLLADGKHRRVEAPKRKNPKHVQRVARCGRQAMSGTLTNRTLYRMMAAFAAGKSEDQGGM